MQFVWNEDVKRQNLIVTTYYIKEKIEIGLQIRKWFKKQLSKSYQSILNFNSSYHFLRKTQKIWS